MTNMAENGSDFIKDLGDAARRNPVSAALIGMGLVWLFAGSKSAASAAGDMLHRTGMDRLPEAAMDSIGAAQDKVASAADAVRERGNESIETVTRMASEYANAVPDPGDVVGRMRSNLADLFKAQPLALGTIGLAIGAGIAAALPSTDIENSYLGDASEALKSKSAEIAGEQMEKIGSHVVEAVGTATEEARKQGLTMEGAKAAMDDLSGKFGRVVDAAGRTVSEGVK
jgi:hypothetical protein